MSETLKNFVPSLSSRAELTKEPATFATGAKGGFLYPEFMGHEEITRVFGLKRSHLYQLKDKGVIKSVALRARGALKGRRLFHVESIREFLHANIEEVPAVSSVPTKEVPHVR